jgi:hypothetical protein
MKKAGLGFLLLMAGAALLAAQTARIREISGTVEIKRPGAPDWEAAKAGQALDTAALISTGFKSTALVDVGNSTVLVRPLTRLSLEELAGTGERVALNLRAGRIRAEVKPPAGGKVDFTIRSPSVTASVRGTVFDFDGVRLRVEEGRVYLAGENAAGAYISTGHAVEAAETGTVPAVITAVKETLAPAPPAGVDTVPVIITPGPSRANLDLRFDWSGQ